MLAKISLSSSRIAEKANKSKRKIKWRKIGISRVHFLSRAIDDASTGFVFMARNVIEVFAKYFSGSPEEERVIPLLVKMLDVG